MGVLGSARTSRAVRGATPRTSVRADEKNEYLPEPSYVWRGAPAAGREARALPRQGMARSLREGGQPGNFLS